MYITTFGQLVPGQEFKVIWATGERTLMPPNTIYTKTTPTPGDGGWYNATTADETGKLWGIRVNDKRAVLALPDTAGTEPLARLAAPPVAELEYLRN